MINSSLPGSRGMAMAKRLSLIRNIVVIVGIIAGFVIWLFVPVTIKNSSILHVGNGEYGSKWGMLLALPLPLFSYFFHRKNLDFYGTDEELKKEEQEKSDMHQIRMGLITAVVMAGIVIGLMLLPFIL